MTEGLKQLREALRRVKHEAASLADAQVIALEALTQRPAAQAGAREAFESVLIDGVAYDVHAPVAAELLRLHIELQALPTQLAQNDAFFVLDDEAKAMIVNSHHYTPADIRALIERFKSFADPEQTDLADWDNLDWRGLCNVTWRVMMGLACDLSPSATPEPVGESRDRKADRARFTDPDFNRWLDEAITETGEHTVWDALKSTGDAYAGWRVRPDYTHAAQPVPMTDDQVWHSDGIMSANGIAGFKLDALMRIVRAVEAHHGITAQAKKDGA